MALKRARIVREIDTPLTPREALGQVAGLPGRVLLESADLEGCSILSVDPIEVLRTVGEVTEVVGADGGRLASYADPFDALSAQLGRIGGDYGADLPSLEHAPGAQPGDLPFHGGLIGFLSYEAADTLEALPPPPADDVGMPDAWFGLYDHAVVWDHESGRCAGVAAPIPGRPAEDAERRLAELVGRLEADVGTGRTAASTPEPPASEPTSSLDRDRFRDGVRRIRELIGAGEFFQANLTRRVSARTGIPADVLYARLVEASAGGLSAFIDTGAGVVASVSPELYLSLRGSSAITRPIKGTAPRGLDAEEDERLAGALLASGKDRAENVMIVDLLRNDLSKVCRAGSVRVSSLNELETHPTVHHLVSTVEGELAAGVGPVDLIRATFPSGSVTGAPKIRAMAVLRELEPVRRGVYTGAIGLLDASGTVDLSVAIRTTVVRDGYAHYGTGGGITLSSDPDSEWDETEVKAEAFRRALGIG